MKILVGLKHVPDTETKIKPGVVPGSIDETGIKWIMSPYDEFALEQALRIKEAGGGGEVIVATLGADAAQATLRQGLALGADRALLVVDARFACSDALVRARALAAIVRSEQLDLVLLGKYGVGTDEGQTGPMLAELLDWPHASALIKLELGADRFQAEREVEGAVEEIEGQLPAVLSCEKGLNAPRYASLKGIMQAKKKPIEIRSLADLGLDPAALGEPQVVWEALDLPPARGTGRIIAGPTEAAVAELVRVLREEAKVI